MNINRGGLQCALLQAGCAISGVTVPMLYFGSAGSFFSLHVEDMDLPSINFLWDGKPKVWFGIGTEHEEKVKRMAGQLFGDARLKCKHFLRHKQYLVSQDRLKAAGIPISTTVHYPGEFIVTFPGAFHFGFNMGFNVAESKNFIPAEPSSFLPGFCTLQSMVAFADADPGAVSIDLSWLQSRWIQMGLLSDRLPPPAKLVTKGRGRPL